MNNSNELLFLAANALGLDKNHNCKLILCFRRCTIERKYVIYKLKADQVWCKMKNKLRVNRVVQKG